MGISGLLPLLKSIHRECNLQKFRGKTLGIDAYGWLHRGTTSCAMDLALGKPTRKFVDFAMHRVRMLQHFGVIPYLIFDGDYLPSKASTEKDRSKHRDQSRKAGLELLNAGKTSQAHLEFQKAVDVTPEMARQLIDDLKQNGVKYVVAPYEADAQMVYLETKGIIDGIISEDSDLLVFGAKCLLTKLDQYGNCVQINRADFCAVKEISLTGWSDADFRRMSILSGCDYLASIQGMGLKTAYRLVRKHKTIEKIIRMLQFDGKFHVPPGYLEDFYQAELTFLHQRVYCPIAQSLVFHTNPKTGTIDEEKMPYIGASVDPKIAQGVARGDLNPMTKKPIIVKAAPPPMVRSVSHFKTPVTDDDLKKGVSIETFFKKRVPLAELDPNCFRPSHSQQALLNNPTVSWAPSPALPVLPRPYLNRAASNPNPLTQNTPPARAHVSRTHTRSLTISEPRASKRARLCADAPTLSSTDNVEALSSKFFNSVAPEKSRRRQSKKQDINIYSDDSIEEAMLDLPDVGGSTKSCKKLPIFDDATSIVPGNQVEEEQSYSQANAATSQITTPSLTMSSSVTSSAGSAEASKPAAIEKLKERFTFSGAPLSTPNSRVSHGIYTPPSSNPEQTRSRIPVPTKSAVSSHKTFSTKASLTPLQRMGANAANRYKSPMTPPITPVLGPVRRSPRTSMLSKQNKPFPEAIDHLSKMETPAKQDETTNKSIGGSEDLIIHDSEEEDNSLSPTPERENGGGMFESVTPPPKIDFGRFAYKH